MQVFISHSEQDRHLVRQLTDQLAAAGVNVWNPFDAIQPGDNAPKLIGDALADSDVLVVLFTPTALKSEHLQREIEFALTSQQYRGRVVSVLVGDVEEIPWILRKLAVVNVRPSVEQRADFSEVVREVENLAHAS